MAMIGSQAGSFTEKKLSPAPEEIKTSRLQELKPIKNKDKARITKIKQRFHRRKTHLLRELARSNFLLMGEQSNLDHKTYTQITGCSLRVN